MVKNKNTRSKVLNNKKVLMIALVAIGVVGVVLILWPLVRNDSFYSADKDQTKSKLEATLNNINLPDSLVYSSVSDLGCDGRNSVGLATSIHCELVGEKYYKSQGTVETNVNLLNQQLEKEGWSTSTYANASYESTQRSIAVTKGVQEGSAPYKSNDSHAYLRLYVEFFKDGDRSTESYMIKQLIKDNKIAQPSNGESVYGIRLEKTYWTCSSSSLLKLPCPASPSKPL